MWRIAPRHASSSSSSSSRRSSTASGNTYTHHRTRTHGTAQTAHTASRHRVASWKGLETLLKQYYLLVNAGGMVDEQLELMPKT